MGRLTVVAGLCVLLLICASPVHSAAAKSQSAASVSQACGYLSIDYTRLPGEHFKRMYIRSVGGKRCTRARAVMRRYRDDPRPCTIAGGNTCSRRYSDGWLCYAPTAGSFPLVQACDRDAKRIRGYVRVGEGRRGSRAARASLSQAKVRKCGGIAFTPRTEDGVYRIRARGTSCRRARRVARAVEPIGIVEGPYEYSAAGFKCRGRFDEASALPVVNWRCTRNRAWIKFARA